MRAEFRNSAATSFIRHASLQFFAHAGEQLLPPLGWLDVALAKIDRALDLLHAFAGHFFPYLLLHVVNVQRRPGGRPRISELFACIVAHSFVKNQLNAPDPKYQANLVVLRLRI